MAAEEVGSEGLSESLHARLGLEGPWLSSNSPFGRRECQGQREGWGRLGGGARTEN